MATPNKTQNQLSKVAADIGFTTGDVAAISKMPLLDVHRLLESDVLGAVMQSLGARIVIMGGENAIRFWVSKRRIEEVFMVDEARVVAGVPRLDGDADAAIGKLIVGLRLGNLVGTDVIADQLAENFMPCPGITGNWHPRHVVHRMAGIFKPLRMTLSTRQSPLWRLKFINGLTTGLLLCNPGLIARYGVELHEHSLYYDVISTRPAPNCVRDHVRHEFESMTFLTDNDGAGLGEIADAAFAALQAPPALRQPPSLADLEAAKVLRRERENRWIHSRRQQIVKTMPSLGKVRRPRGPRKLPPGIAFDWTKHPPIPGK